MRRQISNEEARRDEAKEESNKIFIELTLGVWVMFVLPLLAEIICGNVIKYVLRGFLLM
jgi:hypothetical protein